MVKWANRASPTIEAVATILANTLRASKPTERAGEKPWYWHLRAGLHFWHLASLDAPTVAVAWGWAFAWTAHVRLAVWPLALLGLVVWALYVGDRLLDARAGFSNPPSHDLRERHYFHWRHRWVLAPLAGAAGLAAAWIARLRIPLIALPQDSVVAVATLAYFSGVHSRFRPPAAVTRMLAVVGSRECLVGALFALGCVLPAWSMDPVWSSPTSPIRLLALPAIYFAALAWLNVRTITHWEAPAAMRSDLRVGRAALWLVMAGLAIAMWLLPMQPRAAALVTAGAVSALLIGWLEQRRGIMSPLTLRATVDLILLTPLALVAVVMVR